MELEYYAILTEIGTAAIANATVLGQKIALTQFAVGDGGGSYYKPTKEMTALKGEKWRGEINSYEVDSSNPDLINVKAVIPAMVGGFTIREMGLFDKTGRLIAIANTPDSVKITTDSGAVKEMEMVMELLVSNANIVSIQVNPTVSIATKQDIEKHNSSVNAHKKQFHQYLSLTAQMIENSTLQRDIVIPATGWNEIAEGGEGGVTIDVIQENVTETMIPIVNILHSDMHIATNCGMSTSAKTVNGAVRLFAQRIPKREIRASLLLLKASSSIGGDITENGNGMNIEAFYKDYVATSDDMKPIIDELKK